MNQRRLPIEILSTLLLFTLAAAVMAAAPAVYRGHAGRGADVPADGFYPVILRLFDAPEGGRILWTEQIPEVWLSGGEYLVTLETDNPLPSTPGSAWLEVVFDGVVLTPREEYRGGVDEDCIIDGNLVVDGNTLYVTATGNRVGIGTTSPTQELHVIGEAAISSGLEVGSNILRVTTSRVGVKTSSPTADFDVYGDAVIREDLTVRSNKLLVNSTGVGIGGSPYSGNALTVDGNARFRDDLVVDYDLTVGGDALLVNGGSDCVGINHSTSSSYALYVGGNCRITGNFQVDGSKNAVIQTRQGERLLFCTESPEVWVEEIGSGRLKDGSARIDLDPLFLDAVVIDQDHTLKVFIQPGGDCAGLFVEKGDGYFVVRERNRGTSSIPFDFRVLAKRRTFEDVRWTLDE